MLLLSRLYRFWLVFSLNGTQSDHTVFIFSKLIRRLNPVANSVLDTFDFYNETQTITQCFEPKERYQKNKYFKL